MFRASLLPSQSLYGSWASVQDIRSWAAIEDSVWVQFAKCLGDESLDTVSMLASMLPSDIKEATEATQANLIARTKLRLSMPWPAGPSRRGSSSSGGGQTRGSV